jgi:hypothetical protein
LNVHPVIVSSETEDEDEDELLRQCNRWVSEQGLPEGEMMYELADTESGEAVAILDLAWPNGLQEGLSQPVALLIDEPIEVEEAVNRAGFTFFTSVKSFRGYVKREILAGG